MNMTNALKLKLAGIALFGLFIFLVIVSLLFNSFGGSRKEETSQPTPTPVPYTRAKDGTFTFTPLSKTKIGVTTAKEVEATQTILSKTTANGITTYTIPSARVGKTDEIKTQFGVVIFENTNTYTLAKGDLPKTSIYTKEFGQPEKTLDEVSQEGKFISAYIYAERGFTLFANRYTGTVYQIQRYTPMSPTEYEKTYSSYLQKAPEYPKEFFTK